jgi:hypothetical protein
VGPFQGGEVEEAEGERWARVWWWEKLLAQQLSSFYLFLGAAGKDARSRNNRGWRGGNEGDFVFERCARGGVLAQSVIWALGGDGRMRA